MRFLEVKETNAMPKLTEKNIHNALIRLKHGRPRVISKKRKISIRALAEEAGVSDSTIHNRYPDIAMEVRRLIGKEYQEQRDKKNEKLKAEIEKNGELRRYLERLESENSKLASINARLMEENNQLKLDSKKSNKLARIY
jgi:lambda repressor-like predicted transcriptional regulator